MKPHFTHSLSHSNRIPVMTETRNQAFGLFIHYHMLLFRIHFAQALNQPALIRGHSARPQKPQIEKTAYGPIATVISKIHRDHKCWRQKVWPEQSRCRPSPPHSLEQNIRTNTIQIERDLRKLRRLRLRITCFARRYHPWCLIYQQNKF